jgi:preprotein translocase YajC subunit
MLKGLKIGDQVVTASGLIGTIKNMTDKIVTIEIADSVRVKMLRGQVSHIVTGSLDDVPEAAT